MQGDEARSKMRVWNRGNNRVKFMTIINKGPRKPDKRKSAHWDEAINEVSKTEPDTSILTTPLPADPALGGLTYGPFK